MSKRVRLVPESIGQSPLAHELWAVLPFSSDIVTLVVQYARPCLPALVTLMLERRTRKIWQFLEDHHPMPRFLSIHHIGFDWIISMHPIATGYMRGHYFPSWAVLHHDDNLQRAGMDSYGPNRLLKWMLLEEKARQERLSTC